MSRRIIGVTVGTPQSPQSLKEKLNLITSINGVKPDENGNVKIDDIAVTDEQITQAVNEYLEENPIPGGSINITASIQNNVLVIEQTTIVTI